MKIIEKRLDYGTPWTLPDVYLFTGNPITTGSGKLVMGRGAAAAVRDRYRGVDVAMAQAVLGAKKHGRQLAWVAIEPQQAIGWFQVKAHWQEQAVPELIAKSARELAVLAGERPHLRFHLNAPGIGNGRLVWADVEPLLAPLPDNVIVYRDPPAPGRA